ncbi:Gemin6 [Halteromyces radiatus]|uniref:Gemin6 n=1 Tax=Halteromyces radiatus TaxID=101107 RepID=UPI00221FAD89|nr:Gemin6 [Halteromyces radiatus]KAI8089502.1 Gemin6 [Halteromyces radiatus]
MEIPIGCWTVVTLKSGTTRQGYFYTVDPESKSMILYNQGTAIVVLGHSIQYYQFDKEKTMKLEELETALHCHQNHVPTDQQLEERKRGLIDYMKKHHIPITHSADDPVIQVLGCARVQPPYVSTSITGDNIILRKRVRDLVTQYDQTNIKNME